MSDSRALKSNGSSESTADAVVAEAEDEEESEREASRAALPPFLYVGVVLLKARMVGVWRAVAATRVDGLNSYCQSRKKYAMGSRGIPEATLSCNSNVPRQQARTKQLCRSCGSHF